MKPELGEWIGVDFDGTLATYDSKQFPALGEPIPAMVERIKRWHAAGIEVRIVTARANPIGRNEESFRQVQEIERWCIRHIGFKPRVTYSKDFSMVALYDDRAVQVEKNTGRILGVEAY